MPTRRVDRYPGSRGAHGKDQAWREEGGRGEGSQGGEEGVKNSLTHLDAGLDAARKLALDVDNRVDPLAAQVEAALKTAQAAIADARPLVEDLRRLAAKLARQSRHSGKGQAPRRGLPDGT